MTPDVAPLERSAVEDALAPFGRSRMLPREAYVDDAVLAWERRRFFDHGWVCVGRGADMPAPGDQLATSAGTTPILLTRDRDGGLHALANICRHRGHELLACGARANRGVVQCPYHAWSYELDGQLRIAPRFDGVPGFDPAAMGLRPIRHAEVGGWLFVNVSGDAPPVEVHLAGLAELLAPWDPAALRTAARHTYELQANWKLVHENYNECYHCPLIHPELCRVTPPDSGENVPGPAGAWVGGSMRLEDHAQTMSLDGRSPVDPLPGLDATRRRQVLYLSVFPNLLVSLHPDYVMTHRLEPLTPGATRVTCEWLFSSEAVDRPDFDPGYAVDFWDLTNRQDWAAVESVQRGMGSPMFVPGLLARQEDAVYQFVTLVARGYLGGPLVPSAMPPDVRRRSSAAS